MKNFKYPLVIEGSKEELEAVIPKLEELGYVFNNIPNRIQRLLITQTNGISNEFMIVQSTGDHWNGVYNDIKRKGDRTRIQASNPDLVLALAAMVDDDKFYAGESIMPIEIVREKFELSLELHTFVTILKIEDVDWFNLYRLNKSLFRKATKEEIIAHFTPKTMQDKQEKELLGYAIADEFNTPEKIKMIGRALNAGTAIFQDGTFLRYNDFSLIDQAINLKVLDLWFKPVYKEDKPIVITLSSDSGSFEIHVSKEGIIYPYQEDEISIKSLENLLQEQVQTNINNWAITVHSYNIGCRPNIPVADIRKVVDAFYQLNKQ